MDSNKRKLAGKCFALGMIVVALVAAGAGHEVCPPPESCPPLYSSVNRFVSVKSDAKDRSWVAHQSVTGICLVPDHSYKRTNGSWYKLPDESTVEVRESWKVIFCGTDIECNYDSLPAAEKAVVEVLRAANRR